MTIKIAVQTTSIICLGKTFILSTLYRIACVPTQKPHWIGLLFTKGSLISARLLQRSDTAPLRS